jgi:hypothetical protein
MGKCPSFPHPGPAMLLTMNADVHLALTGLELFI